MTYEQIAKKIIKKSIRSAICIDDRFEQPYMTPEEVNERNEELTSRDKIKVVLDKNLPRNLHTSFRELGQCDLDIYNFKSLKDSWRPGHMLNNKDLMVIDWELDGNDGFLSTITILQHTIETNEYANVPFIIIYTSKPEADFGFIIDSIISYFNPFGTDRETKLALLHENLLDKFANCFEITPDLDNIKDFLEHIKVNLFEYWKINNSGVRNTIIKEIAKKFDDHFGVLESKKGKIEPKLNSCLKATFGDNMELFECLYYLSIDFVGNLNFLVDRIGSKDIGLKINNSIITIFSKDHGAGEGVKPEEVFETFSNLLCKDPHNFLTLLSIEMRDKLRDDSYKIGDKISSLDERAFFYHLGNYKLRSKNYKNEFFDFLLKSWTNEIDAYNINQTPEVFGSIEEYVKDKNLEKAQIPGNEIHQQLADLAIKLSTVDIYNRTSKDSMIRFGDIFKATGPDNVVYYYLCITPQCVCVDASKKVDNNFFFIKAENSNIALRSALENIEIGYYSLIKDNVNISLKWGDCKPFTIWVRTNDIGNLKSKFTHYELDLKYVTSLKENFAQRMSNKAFGYGTSIGIDLPHL